jgi:hypothetical protein
MRLLGGWAPDSAKELAEGLADLVWAAEDAQPKALANIRAHLTWFQSRAEQGAPSDLRRE